MESIPIVDIGPLVRAHRAGEYDPGELSSLTTCMHSACRTAGFFYATGFESHALWERIEELEGLSREFFELATEEKSTIRMERGGRAWRGYFPVGGELTAGVADHKEGLYFGAELGPDEPKVQRRVPLHGPNLFPEHPALLRGAVLDYMEMMTELGHALVAGLALSLGLEARYFERHYTKDPLVLFRIFHYPTTPADENPIWGVGEHTDYGLLTILKQDQVGGLQIQTPESSGASWIDAPPLDKSFVCNIGDMLERMTGGLYRSTPHRVLNQSEPSGRSRLSFPFFFDPNFDAEVHPIPTISDGREAFAEKRWDGRSPHRFQGTYGEYLLDKVSRVFPQLHRDL